MHGENGSNILFMYIFMFTVELPTNLVFVAYRCHVRMLYYSFISSVAPRYLMTAHAVYYYLACTRASRCERVHCAVGTEDVTGIHTYLHFCSGELKNILQMIGVPTLNFLDINR